MNNFSNLTNITVYRTSSIKDLTLTMINLVIYSITAFLGSILNLLLIFIWLMNPIKKIDINLLYGSMAIADFFFNVYLPFEILRTSNALKFIPQSIDSKLLS